MQKIPLSVIILAEENSLDLQTAIKSVVFVDEIIVVDTSGTDRISLTQPPDVIIQKLPKITDFSVTRNQSLQFAKNDWVFFLDSDETCVCQNGDFFTTLFQKNASAFRVKREDQFLGKILRYGETAQSWPTRLIQKKHCIYTGSVHETITCDGVIGIINPQLMTLSHSPHPTISSFFSKICWYSSIEAQQRTTQSLRLALETVVFPTAKWLNNLFVRKGILDGYRGLLYATLMSYHSLLVRLFQIEKLLTKKRHD